MVIWQAPWAVIKMNTVKQKDTDHSVWQVLVLAPTRELAKQVADDFTSVSSGLTVLSVYGGVFYEKQGNFSLFE